MNPVAWYRRQPERTRNALVVAAFVVATAAVPAMAALVGSSVLGVEGGGEAPEAAFSLYQRGEESVVVVHGGGERVPAGRLRVSVGDEAATWAARDRSLGPDDPVGPGATLSLPGADRGDVVAVAWVPPDGGPAEVLARFTVR